MWKEEGVITNRGIGYDEEGYPLANKVDYTAVTDFEARGDTIIN